MNNDLTEREKEILDKLCESPALSIHEIALQLGLKYGTIRTHVSNILTKLGVSDMREAVIWKLHQELATWEITEMAKDGRRQAIVRIKAIVPVGIAEAVIQLNVGKTVYVMSVNVDEILQQLED